MSADEWPILFASSQSPGLCNSSLVVAGELAKRGVKNLWFATEETRRADVEALCSVSEVRFVSLGNIGRSSVYSWDEKTYRAVTQRSRIKAYTARVKNSLGTTYHPLEQYQALDEAVERIRPVLMVINNLCFHGVQVAMTRKIPFVLTSSLLPSDLYQCELPRDYPTPISGFPQSMPFLQRVAHRIFRLRMKFIFLNPVILWRGIKYHDLLTRKGGVDRRALSERAKMEAAELAISFSIFGLDYTFPAPPKLHMLGAVVPDLPENPRGHELIEWLDNHSSVVYAAFGTITRLARDEVNAMIDVAYRLGDTHCLLWKLPEEQQHLLPDVNKLPANVRIESWFPSQYEVLAHKNVRVFFNHGGSNSFHEGVFFGKPLLVRPLWLDCYDLAVRTVDSGVGLVVDRPETIDADDVHHKLTRLLSDNTFTERAQYFAELQRAAGGAAKAADLILSCAAKCARNVDVRRD